MTLFNFNLPIDLGSAIVGGIIGLLLVLAWEWLTKPRIFWFNYSFIKEKVNFGTLYKLKFKVWGLRSPGFCEFQIHWGRNMVRGKWDESPNPLHKDDLNQFEPALVPQSFFLPLMLKQYYTVPILHEDDKSLTVFSGWWFGRKMGYGPNPRINKKAQLTLIIKGNNLEWRKKIKVEDIISNSK